MTAGLILRDVDILIAGYDVQTDHNEASVELGRESLDPTVFGNATRRVKGGLKTSVFNVSGFYQAGQNPEKIDDILAQVVEGQLVSLWPQNRAEGNRGRAMLVSKSSHQPFGGAVGDLAPFNATFEAAGDILRPTSLKDGVETTSGSGSVFQEGAVSSTQRITGILHVLAASGTTPTLDVIIESAALVGFASPTTRITFPQLGAAGIAGFSVPAPVNGPITDEFWRASWTIGGGTPSFTFLVGLYIGPRP